MKYYYTYNCPDIDNEIYTSEYDSLDDLLTSVSRSICFTGWKPNMEFVYEDAITGEIVWTGRFPDWEH